MPQISFQVNVATVEYKPKKQMTSGYGQIEPMTFVSTKGPGNMLANSMMPTATGGIGIADNSNDRGDEINLDEL